MINFPASVKCVEIAPGYPVLDVDHAAAKGRIALNGAHVMEWKPSGESPVLYMSPDAELHPGKAIRGGIPICWPWFGPHPSLPDAPAHGLVRTRMWELESVNENSSGVEVKLKLQGKGQDEPRWPFDFSLRLRVWMGAELEVALEIKNTSTSAWMMTGALHTYLNVADASAVKIRGLHGTCFVEGRLSPEKRLQNGDVVIHQEVDRIYASDAAVEVEDIKGGRTLVIEKAGSHSTVIWNPWIEKSKRLSDLPDEAYPGFLCIETTNAGDDRVVVPAGGDHTLLTRVRVRRPDSGGL